MRLAQSKYICREIVEVSLKLSAGKAFPFQERRSFHAERVEGAGLR